MIVEPGPVRTALAVGGIVLAGLFAPAGAASAPSRGELLYTTHCVACHGTQMHWRDQRRATDFESLKEQVRLWQGRALLSWTEDDILEVTRYLDQHIYRFGRATAARPGQQPKWPGVPGDGIRSAGFAIEHRTMHRLRWIK